ncbi:hypothetical protein ACFSCZ_19620 [Siminovitchia sediminis]|uniref:Uncharacterized protein n=1 Tax=Siminovitchia sediminis TaxID=1274353 RepID=A0ABW4KLX3_9BACI
MHKKKALILFAVAALVVIGGGLYVYTSNQPATGNADVEQPADETDETAQEGEPSAAGVPDIENYDQAVVWKSGKEEEGKRKIAQVHEFYNELLGWGNAEHIKWDSLNFSQMQEDIQEIYETVEPSKIENDIRNAETLLQVAIHERDSMSLRWLHRIVHDLDYHLNQAEIDREWDVTDAFDGDPDVVRNYLLGSGFFAGNE